MRAPISKTFRRFGTMLWAGSRALSKASPNSKVYNFSHSGRAKRDPEPTANDVILALGSGFFATRSPGMTLKGGNRAPAPFVLMAERTAPMSSFSLFTIGYVILVIGLAYAAYLVDVPREWIIVGLLILAGL